MNSNARSTSLHLSLIGFYILVLVAARNISAADWPQWRGPNRDGHTTETGLLQEWPANGPALVWQSTNIGSGYAAPVVAGDRLFVLANEGLSNEFVAAINTKNGERIWSARIGDVGNPKQQPNFPAARSTPTIDGNSLFALGSDGDLACLEKDTGKVKWRKSLRQDFGGKPGTWAYAESPLIDGDTLLCTPGGSQATLVALRKTTGDLLWKCALPEADEAAYASALAIEAAGMKQYVQLLQKGLVGVEAKSGKFLWRYDKAVSRFNANIPTPLASDGCIYVASAGTGAGAVKLVAKDGGIAVEPLYFTAQLPTAIGGVVKVGGFLYGTTAQGMQCVDFATGNVKWENTALRASSMCYADGRLYLHSEDGDAGLVEPSPEGYRQKGRFTPPHSPPHSNAMEKAWAYPVVSHGKLYLRDHGALWCYDVQASK